MSRTVLEVQLRRKSVEDFLKRISNKRTREDYGRKIQKFLEIYDLDLDGTIAEWEKVKYNLREKEIFQDRVSQILQDYYDSLMDHTPYVRWGMIVPILSFFRKYLGMKDVRIRRERYMYVKYVNRDIGKEEIRRILEHADLRDKCFFLMMLESGLRPSTLIQLKYKHIKEDFEAQRIPMRINLPSEILKDRVSSRFSFIGEDAFEVLREYLSLRGHLDPEDFIFRPKREKGGEISTSMFSKAFGKIVRKLGLVERSEKRGKPQPLRLYCLRKYFRNNMKVDSSYIRFWMGHSLGSDEHYISRDPEEHRKIYAKGYKFLRIFGSEDTKLREEVEKLKDQLTKVEKELEKERRTRENLMRTLEVVTSERYVEELLLKSLRTIKPEKLRKILRELEKEDRS
ncbi:tyrosine-type recombinase/integrase [Candidatus Bathyarchaeota archaeon]|nr:tyrosine-type recombinase/integrase [Candidatus Bathyarchaeota archaeon]